MLTRKRLIGTLKSAFKAPYYVQVEYSDGRHGGCGHRHRSVESALRCERALGKRSHVRSARAMRITNQGTAIPVT